MLCRVRKGGRKGHPGRTGEMLGVRAHALTRWCPRGVPRMRRHAPPPSPPPPFLSTCSYDLDVETRLAQETTVLVEQYTVRSAVVWARGRPASHVWWALMRFLRRKAWLGVHGR